MRATSEAALPVTLLSRISHQAIIYPVAATVTAKLEADTYLSYLRSTAAIKAVVDKYGFIYLWRRVAC